MRCKWNLVCLWGEGMKKKCPICNGTGKEPFSPKNVERIKELEEEDETFSRVDSISRHTSIQQRIDDIKEADANAIEWVEKQIDVLREGNSLYLYAKALIDLLKILEGKS